MLLVGEPMSTTTLEKIGNNLVNMKIHVFYLFKAVRRHVAALLLMTKNWK